MFRPGALQVRARIGQAEIAELRDEGVGCGLIERHDAFIAPIGGEG
jgi:hypothetical protein